MQVGELTPFVLPPIHNHPPPGYERRRVPRTARNRLACKRARTVSPPIIIIIIIIIGSKKESACLQTCPQRITLGVLR
eukprot:862508-Pyramimonas_sp.AAC.2